MSKARDIASASPAPSTVSATELGYLDGVTSAIQTQINSKIGSASAINPTIVDAKGDLIAATAADTVARLAVGANDTVLTADSSTATGLKWAAVSAGGMTLISETVASANSSISFSSLGSYKQLLLLWTGLYCSNTTTSFNIRFNNDSGLDYYHNMVGWYGTTPTFYWNQGGPMEYAVDMGTYGAGTSSTLTIAGKGHLRVDNYTSTSKLKHYDWSKTTKREGGQFDSQAYVDGVYDGTSAITSIDIYRHEGSGTLSNLANTSIRLYGIS